MKRLLSLVLAMFVLLPSFAKEKENTMEYQIEGEGVGNGGTNIVNITIVSKKNDITEEKFAQCAVHGILFRGYTNSLGSYSSSTVAPMAGSPINEMEHADFYKEFFKSTYKGYVQIMDSSRKVVKVGKEYKITTAVAVSTSQLRRDLEKMGIIKSLKSGW